jgi:hypothetical protein
MTPDEAASWCRSMGLQITWTSSRSKHLVRFSGLEVVSVVREYDPNNSSQLSVILDEMVVEMKRHLSGNRGDIHSSLPNLKQKLESDL